MLMIVIVRVQRCIMVVHWCTQVSGQLGLQLHTRVASHVLHAPTQLIVDFILFLDLINAGEADGATYHIGMGSSPVIGSPILSLTRSRSTTHRPIWLCSRHQRPTKHLERC